MPKKTWIFVLLCGLLSVSFGATDAEYLNALKDVRDVCNGTKTAMDMKNFGFAVKDLYYQIGSIGGSSDLLKMRQAMNAADKMLYNAKLGSGLMKTAQKDNTLEELVNKWIDPLKKTRAWGIASTGVSIYMKVRTTVRYAYEEIQLWKGIYEDYKSVKSFFDEFGKAAQKFGDDFEGLFLRGEGHGFVEKLKKFVDIYDQGAALQKMPETLNQRLLRLENDWDRFAADTFSYTFGPWTTTLGITPGVVIPNSERIFTELSKKTWDNKYVDYVADRTNPGWREEERKATPIGQKTYPLTIDSLGRQYDTKTIDTLMPNDPFRYYTLPIISNEILLASAIALSNGYMVWSQRTMGNMRDLDKKLDDIVRSDTTAGGVNGLEFAATWYAIETVNAKNKLLRHSVEETKILTALVGTDLHLRSTKREAELRNSINFGR